MPELAPLLFAVVFEFADTFFAVLVLLAAPFAPGGFLGVAVDMVVK